jgi:hypothetical protein
VPFLFGKYGLQTFSVVLCNISILVYFIRLVHSMVDHPSIRILWPYIFWKSVIAIFRKLNYYVHFFIFAPNIFTLQLAVLSKLFVIVPYLALSYSLIQDVHLIVQLDFLDRSIELYIKF